MGDFQARSRFWPAFGIATVLAIAALGTSPADAQTQGNGQRLTIVLSEEPDTLDGCNANSSATGRVIRNTVVEALAEIDPKDGSLMPRLATSWERIDDLRWRFKLRQGVVFHDGTPFNADTAIKSMSRTLDTQLDCETRLKFFGGLKVKGEKVDDYTLDVVTDKPVPILPTYMGSLMLTSPNQPFDKLANAIGTGPYVLAAWNGGIDIQHKRFDKYWGPKPQAESVRYIWRNKSSVRAAMVKVGEADLAPDISMQDATDPSDRSYLNAETSMLRIDTHIPPLNDVRVRKALNLAFDRSALRGTVMSKDVVPATQAVIFSIAGYNPELDKRPWPYDPAKAKQLLAEAKADGVPVDREITLYGRIGLYPNSTEVMETFLEWYKGIGLNVKLRMLEVAEWRKVHSQPFAEDRPPNLVQTQHDNNSGDPVFTVYFRYACQGSVSAYCDPEFDKQIVHTSTLTGQERVRAWQEIFRSNFEDRVADVLMYHQVGYVRAGSRINFTPSVTLNSEIQVARITFK